MKKESESMFWYLQKVYNGYKKAILTSIACTLIICFSGFVYSNAKLPAQEAKIDAIQIDINILKSNEAKERVEKALIKNDIKQIMNTNADFKKDFLEALKEMNRRLDKIYDRTDETNKTVRTWK